MKCHEVSGDSVGVSAILFQTRQQLSIPATSSPASYHISFLCAMHSIRVARDKSPKRIYLLSTIGGYNVYWRVQRDSDSPVGHAITYSNQILMKYSVMQFQLTIKCIPHDSACRQVWQNPDSIGCHAVSVDHQSGCTGDSLCTSRENSKS